MVDFLSISGGKTLEGRVRVSGAKNAALPLMIAGLLSSEETTLTNVPDLEDISVLIRLLRSLGAEVRYADDELKIRTPRISGHEAPYGLVKALRASFWVLGPLLARAGKAIVSLPGGDAIGTRPVDLHLNGLSQLGADVRIQHGAVVGAVPEHLRPADITLAYPSVGATHQLLMTAALIPGHTILRGAACEPEVVALADLLTSMGATVRGAGTSEISIDGQAELKGGSARIIGDRIEAATFLLAGAMSGGKVTVSGISPDAVGVTINLLQNAGCVTIGSDDSVTIAGRERLRALSFETQPFPGVATDVQPLFMAAMANAEGVSEITETVFEGRFGHVAEYRRFGADIQLLGRTAVITGVPTLSGAPVEAIDIRAAAGLVLMALAAEGESQVYELHHLDRGYENFVPKLQSLGAQVRRIPRWDQGDVVYGC